MITANTFSSTILAQSVPSLATECGLDEAAATALQGVASLIHETTLLLNGAFIGLRRIFECRTFNSVYTTVVHDGKARCGSERLHASYRSHRR